MSLDEKNFGAEKALRLPDTPVPGIKAQFKKGHHNIHTSKSALSAEQHILEQAITVPILPTTQKRVKDILVTQQTQPVIPATQKRHDRDLAFEPTTLMPTLSQPLGEEDDNVLGLQTVSMRTVRDIRVKKKTTTFFASVVGWLLSISFFSGLVYVFIIVPDPIYKVEVLLISLVAFSYIISAQMKLMDRLRPKTKPFISATQLVPAIKKESVSPRDKEMRHFQLIKEDTTTYLRAITKKNLEEDNHR